MRVGFAKSLVFVSFVSQVIVSTAVAGEPTGSSDDAATQKHSSHYAVKQARTAVTPLDRVASAVDGAESSHGTDLAMWRPDPSGPQGPMQVSEAAAVDVGGGDRFDPTENRAIGRAYLLQLYWRYKNWPDAIAAYNWGLGKMDAWVKAGRPSDKLLIGVALYQRRVLHESGLCEDVGAASGAQKTGTGSPKEPVTSPPDQLLPSACSSPDGPGGAFNFAGGAGRFYSKLEAGLRLALQRAAGSR
jgi:Transglycosylase SLT domain